jgi:hypothetical protein
MKEHRSAESKRGRGKRRRVAARFDDRTSAVSDAASIWKPPLGR